MKKTLIVLTILFLLLFGSLAQAATFNKRVRLISEPGPCWARAYDIIFSVNINPQLGFYTENGYSLNSELCYGQKFKAVIETSNNDWIDTRGEWVTIGGACDSPPVAWVESLAYFLNEVKNADKSPITIPKIYDGYVDSLTGIPVYWEGTVFLKPYYGTLVCELPKFKSLDISGAETWSIYGVKKPGTFVVTADKVDISFNTDINCMFYHFCVKKGEGCEVVREIMDMDGKYGGSKTYLGSASEKKSITVTSVPPEPKIIITSTLTNGKLSPQSSTYLKMEVTNTGDKDAVVKNIDLNVDSQLLACESNKLSPGSSTECILWVSPEKSGVIEATVDYQYMKCGERQQIREKFVVGEIEVKPKECSDNRDCLKNYICCEGFCYDSTKGMCVDVNADGIAEWVSTS